MIPVVRCLGSTFRLLFSFPSCSKFGFLGVYSFAGTSGLLLAWVIKIKDVRFTVRTNFAICSPLCHLVGFIFQFIFVAIESDMACWVGKGVSYERFTDMAVLN